MQHKKSLGLIANQHEIVKCKQCNLYYGQKGRTDFYICCYPFKINKIVCADHRIKGNCDSCIKNSASISQSKYVNIQQLDEKFLKKIENQLAPTSQQKSLSIIVFKAGVQCWICHHRLFNSNNSYFHSQCNKYYCYPCFYMVFSLQIKMFDCQDKKLKEKYKMVMVCCKKQGEPIQKIANLFSSTVCVFGGCSSLSNNQLINIKNKLLFCIKCYNDSLNEGIYSDRFIPLYEEIIAISQKNCVYCQKIISIPEDHNWDSKLAFNASLCIDCFKKHKRHNRYTYDQALNLVREFTPDLLKISNFQCQEKQCQQKTQTIAKKKIFEMFKETQTLLSLIMWKDGKKYCGGCLYKKYEVVRKQFEKKNTISDQFVSSSELQWDIDGFYALKKAYQNNFIERCMVCSSEQAITQFKKVKEVQGKNQNKLTCIYCLQCLEFMQKNIKRYKQLADIKQEIINRESYEPPKMQDNSENSSSKSGMFGCIPTGNFFSKEKGQPKIVQVKKTMMTVQNERSKPKNDFGIESKNKNHQQFPQFNTNQQATNKTTPQHKEDTEQFYDLNQEKQVDFENAINHLDSHNIHNQAVNTAWIRLPPQRQKFLSSQQKINRSLDDVIEWVDLKQFQFIEQMSRKSTLQNKLKRKNQTQTQAFSSTQIVQQSINSDSINQFHNHKFVANFSIKLGQRDQTLTLPQQRCKVFSCSNLTGVMSATNQDPRQLTYNHQANQMRQPLDQQNQSPLMMRLMCSDCFVRYLLGIVRQEDIEKQDWDKAMRENADMNNKIAKFIQ